MAACILKSISTHGEGYVFTMSVLPITTGRRGYFGENAEIVSDICCHTLPTDPLLGEGGYC